ncbi:bifunctional riboflavin kinase/FAD synthetase [Oecophyllibacter saccharovorans]|uniref:bifunctional riboflavin kinase/FAD synthetase n=1 Tax=Oecophyllibacter saccharovorans TaxID=2558360 RepID=UPI001169BEFE|nr:bifunctional riboflavin kinase/FAD synthetase [Oecophyllibacter saccharovorans]TPW36293.1 bifunctional riboflavin kinase/FAD synthetase [Oecophyllibacter saccharovorans]
MTLYPNWCTLPAGARGCAVALGNFDGVHRGHVHLLQSLRHARDRALKTANQSGAPVVPPLGVLTFDPHPRQFFRPQDPPFRLMSPALRARTLEREQGVEHVFQMDFDEDFARMPAEIFIREVLIGALGVRHVACGADFAFGHRRGGDAALLKELLPALGVGVTIVPQLADTDGPVSSSRIRRLLQEGYPERAAALLGRPWSIAGEVVRGDQRGRLLGFPTANIRLGAHLEPARGVYAVRVRMPDGRVLPGVANIGRRPTINDGQESRLEVHLFDVDEDLYGQTLEVALISRLRPEKRFDGLEALKAAISADAREARQLLAAGNSDVPGDSLANVKANAEDIPPKTLP